MITIPTHQSEHTSGNATSISQFFTDYPTLSLLEVSVNSLSLPLVAVVVVSGVCVLQVPYQSNPPVLVPGTTEMVPDEGKPVGVLPTELVVVVPPPPPAFARYLIPLDGQLPGVVASIATRSHQ